MLEGVNSTTSISQLRLQHEALIALQQEKPIRKSQTENGSAFAQALRERLNQDGGVQFSKHALSRIAQRGAEVSDTMLSDLNRAVETARSKGAKDTVIIGGNGAFIVNVPNNVVVTVVTPQEMKENVFTNIDSAVLI